MDQSTRDCNDVPLSPHNPMSGVEAILRGERAPYDPTQPIPDNPHLESMRKLAIDSHPENLAAEHAGTGVASLGANEISRVERDVDVKLAEQFCAGAGLPRVPGQEWVVLRYSIGEAAAGTTLLAVLGVFATEDAAEKHVMRCTAATRGQPFDFVVGRMYEMHPWPPSLENTEDMETPVGTYTEIMRGYIERRNKLNEAFRERVASDGISVGESNQHEQKNGVLA